MENASPPHAPPGDTNIANIGADARIDQFAQGENITQIKGATLEEVRVHLAQMYASYQRKPFDGRSPYVGLASFQEQDADRFFGREKLTQELVARIETARFLVIAGPSGSGKSSLARAGLIHTLKRGALAGSENWLYEILTPGRNPLAELARVVSSFTGKLQAGDEIVKRGRADETLLHRWADIALGDQKTRRAILLVDQFEEIFTQVTDESERAAFLNLLVYAATAENGRVTIVCCTRSDFIGNWVKYPNLNDLLRHGLYQIPPMQPDELVSAIARPAIQVGLPIDETLVKEILDDMRAAPGALPLMQFALQDLFEYEKNQGGMIALTRDDYKKRGGLHQALSRHADAAFAKLNPDEQKIARSIFASLIEPGRGNVDTRRTARLQEIVPADTDAAQVKTVIAKLADARLVTTDKKDADETITLAHERLIDAWKWLRDLIDENREAIALQNQINDDAKEWEQQRRDASYLYTGARLATAQEEVAGKKIVLGELTREFVDASISAREREKRKEQQRTRRLIVAFGTAAAVFAVLAVVTFLAQQNAIRSEAKAQAESTRAIEQQQTAEAERDRAEQAEADALSAADAADTAARDAGRQKILAENAKATAVAEAAIARSRELAALARNEFETNPDVAVLLAAEINQAPNRVTFESEDTLRQLLIQYPLESVFRGHVPSRSVNTARFSSDGARVVTTSTDGTAQVWDASSGERLVTLDGHTDYVWSAEFSSDDRLIVTASWDEGARVWDAVNGKLVFILAGHQGGVNSAQFSPDDTRIVTASMDATARVWDAANGEPLAVLRGHAGQVNRAEFSHDGTRILTFSFDDQTVRVWDSDSGAPIAVLRGHNDRVQDAHFSPDDRQIITASWDATARLWDAVTGEELARLGKHSASVESAEFSPDGKFIVTASVDETARVWEIAALLDAKDAGEFSVLRGHSSFLRGARFSPDSKQILTMSDDGTVHVWNLLGKELVALHGHERMINDAQFSHDGKRIVTASDDGTARVWNLVGGKELEALRLPDSQVMDADSCIEKNKLAIANEKIVFLRSMQDGAELVALRGHTAPINRVRFSHDCAKIVTASADETARLWDANTGKELVVLRGHKFQVHSAQFAMDDRYVITGGADATARIWDADTGKELVVLRGHKFPVAYAEFSRDGKRVVTAAGAAGDKSGDETARVWDAGTGEELVTFAGHQDYLTSAQFSPDGSRIVTTSNDRTARVWDIAGRKALLVLNKHLASVNAAQFLPITGAQIITASSDGTTRIWNAASEEQLAILHGGDGEIVHVRYSLAGDKIVTVSKSGMVRVYLVKLQQLAELAKKRIGRALTCVERERYLREQNACPTLEPTPRP